MLHITIRTLYFKPQGQHFLSLILIIAKIKISVFYVISMSDTFHPSPKLSYQIQTFKTFFAYTMKRCERKALESVINVLENAFLVNIVWITIIFI